MEPLERRFGDRPGRLNWGHFGTKTFKNLISELPRPILDRPKSGRKAIRMRSKKSFKNESILGSVFYILGGLFGVIFLIQINIMVIWTGSWTAFKMDIIRRWARRGSGDPFERFPGPTVIGFLANFGVQVSA